MSPDVRKKKAKKRKNGTTVQVKAVVYDDLVIRSKTLHALGMGGGMTCPKCFSCLIVNDKCPGCGYCNQDMD